MVGFCAIPSGAVPFRTVSNKLNGPLVWTAWFWCNFSTYLTARTKEKSLFSLSEHLCSVSFKAVKLNNSSIFGPCGPKWNKLQWAPCSAKPHSAIKGSQGCIGPSDWYVFDSSIKVLTASSCSEFHSHCFPFCKSEYRGWAIRENMYLKLLKLLVPYTGVAPPQVGLETTGRSLSS